MSALAGMLHLDGPHEAPAAAVRRMIEALAHRGPTSGEHAEPGFAVAWRAPSTATETPLAGDASGDITALLVGHVTNLPDLRTQLAGRGHHLKSQSAAEALAHLARDGDVACLEKLRGQFACAVWDRRRRALLLGRDRIGIAPLYWARRGAWLLFASEVKALLASGLVAAEADMRGLDHVMTFMGLSSARTCIAGVQAVLPSCGMLVQNGDLQQYRYWDLVFPEAGQVNAPATPAAAAEELEALLTRAVARNLPAQDSAAAYISGGIDCSTLAALARNVRQRPIDTYTVRIDSPGLDESDRALRVGQACGTTPKIESFDGARILDAFPRLIRAADAPVSDASCATLMLLAQRAAADGRQVVLAGDGADDLFAGYPWFKTEKVMRMLDVIPGFPFGRLLRRAVVRVTAPHIKARQVLRTQALIGGHNAWLDLYGLVSMNRSRFYSRDMKAALPGPVAYEDLRLNLDGLRRWHPLHRALYFGLRTHVPGLLLQAKGDRIAMQSGVQLRYPYLDEDVVDFSTRLPPSWKLHGLRDKYVLRRVAERWLPPDIAWRPKRDFVAPFDQLYRIPAADWVEELLSESALRDTGYFDPAAVAHWRRYYPKLGRLGSRRFSVEIGLAAVLATQLWHRQCIEGRAV